MVQNQSSAVAHRPPGSPGSEATRIICTVYRGQRAVCLIYRSETIDLSSEEKCTAWCTAWCYHGAARGWRSWDDVKYCSFASYARMRLSHGDVHLKQGYRHEDD